MNRSVQIRRRSSTLSVTIEVSIWFHNPHFSDTSIFTRIHSFTIFARGHLFRGSSPSFEITISPAHIFLCGWFHFFRLCKVWRNTRRYLTQNSLAKYCTLHHFREYKSALWNSPGGGSTIFGFKVSKWFGVSGSGASGLLRSLVVRGLELTIHSTSVMKVLNASSSNWLPALRSRISRALRTVRIWRSQVPPMWLEWGTFISNGIVVSTKP